jgi:hypothetical protein
MTTYYLHYTAWEDMTADFRAAVFGDEELGRPFFTHYFYWNGTVHEMGHILRQHYGTTSTNPWEEETAVNDFAAAYWRARGEDERLAHFASLVRRALNTLPDPVPEGEDPAVWFQEHYDDPMPILAYGYFQEQMVLAAQAKQLDLATVLRTLITPTAIAGVLNRPEPYPTLHADLPFQIVDDMRSFLAPYGVELPAMRVIREVSASGIQFVSREEP